jgi:phosphatidylserine decarboxylase
MGKTLKLIKKRRLGGWLPADETALESFRLALVDRVQLTKIALNPEVEKLGDLIKNDPVLRMDFTLAIEQATAAGHKLG